MATSAPRHCAVLMQTAALALVVFLGGCSREAETPRAASGTASTPAQAADRPLLHVVYCNGTVDQLDLSQQAKVGSFQLSARSGTPAAVAPLPRPGVHPDSCLARPAESQGQEAGSAGAVHIVASDRLSRNDTDGRKPYSLLTFDMPGWTLRARQDLGSFDVLNGAPPRVTLNADQRWEAIPPEKDAAADMLAEASHFARGDTLGLAHPLAWSADTVLVEYTATDTNDAAVAMIDRARRSVQRIDGVPGADPQPTLILAPGGKYLLHGVKRMTPVDGGQKLAATGEIRIYGEDGKLVKTLADERVAGDWHAIAVSPGGLAVFTNRKGDYRFVPLGLAFEPKPVLDRLTDDLEGTRPGIVYAAP